MKLDRCAAILLRAMAAITPPKLRWAFLKRPWFSLWCLKIAVILLPKTRLEDNCVTSPLFSRYVAFSDQTRYYLNEMPSEEREPLVLNLLMPTIRRLFDKNYVNAAQYSLLTLEEWFLSKGTDSELEKAMALFSDSAIAAGLRYRQAFPLPEKKREPGEKKKLGFVSFYTARPGFEVMLGLGRHLKEYSPGIYAMRMFNRPNETTLEDACAENGLQLVLPEQQPIYNVFVLRRLLIENKVDVVFWINLPPHMFFCFSFGLAEKQIWFSQYLRSNISFKYLDNIMTLGGSGHTTEKFFNGRDWPIVPQVTYLEKMPIVLFCPSRLEKLRQPSFLEAIRRIMLARPETFFKWTGESFDPEVSQKLADWGLGDRNTYLPWMGLEELGREIQLSDIITVTFPLGFDTVELTAADKHKPMVTMHDQSSLYWGELFEKALAKDPVLAGICLDETGKSILAVNNTVDDYVADAIRLIQDPRLRNSYGRVFHDAYDYARPDRPPLPDGSVVVFSPSRLEKLKQPLFLEAIRRIMLACPEAFFKWTGYEFDQRLNDLFNQWGFSDRHRYIPWMSNNALMSHMQLSDVIAVTFPLAFGTVELMASRYYLPMVTMYHEENTLYWRDLFWEAGNGDQGLAEICFDETGKSILAVNNTVDDYVADAIRLIRDPKLRNSYGRVFHDAYDYAFLNNPRDIGGRIGRYIEDLFRTD